VEVEDGAERSGGSEMSRGAQNGKNRNKMPESGGKIGKKVIKSFRFARLGVDMAAGPAGICACGPPQKKTRTHTQPDRNWAAAAPEFAEKSHFLRSHFIF